MSLIKGRKEGGDLILKSKDGWSYSRFDIKGEIDPLRAKLSAHETKAGLRAVVVEPQTDLLICGN